MEPNSILILLLIAYHSHTVQVHQRTKTTPKQLERVTAPDSR